jgi:hypothetical protein
VGKPLLQKDDKEIVAVASDEEIAGLPVPVLDINDSGTIADFIVKTCALGELGKAS